MSELTELAKLVAKGLIAQQRLYGAVKDVDTANGLIMTALPKDISDRDRMAIQLGLNHQSAEQFNHNLDSQ